MTNDELQKAIEESREREKHCIVVYVQKPSEYSDVCNELAFDDFMNNPKSFSVSLSGSEPLFREECARLIDEPDGHRCGKRAKLEGEGK